jgi:Domain of unknown function (DUF1929)/Carbohydrate binding module (family 6)
MKFTAHSNIYRRNHLISSQNNCAKPRILSLQRCSIRKTMTIKTRTITSSLAALTLAVLLMACPGPETDPTLCSGSGKTTDVGLSGATIQSEDYMSATSGIERRQLSGGPCSLRTTSKDTSGEYALKIAQANDFDVTFNVSANAGAKLRLELDGNPVDNTTLNVTATASAFKEFTLPVLTLPAGDHNLRVVIADLNGSSAVMIDSFKLTKPAKNLPYSGILPNAPFTVEAEHFDRGGDGLSYSDTTPGNSGAGTRISNVDIDVQGKDQFVTNTQPDEYLKYSFNVPASLANKRFNLIVYYAATQADGKFSLSLGGRKLIDKSSVVATSSMTTWRQEIGIGGISAGSHTMVLGFDALASGGNSVMNVDRLEISVNGDVPNDPPPPPPDGVIGETSPLVALPYMPIHAALMPNGKVFTWGGGSDFNKDINTTVWNPASGDGVDARRNIYYSASNLFCAGFSHLPDGRLLIAGAHWDNYVGAPDTNIFDYKAEQISPTSSMYAEKLPNAVGNPRNDGSFDPKLYYKDPAHTGRWYPSTVPLASGEIMVAEGYSSIRNSDVVNDQPEVWQSNAGGGWRTLSNARVTDTGALSFYPFMYARPNGEVIRIGPEPVMYAFSIDGTGSVRKLNTRLDNLNRDYGSAAMFAPGKVLVVGGGGGPGTPVTQLPSKTAVIVDISGTGNPTVTNTSNNMAYGRRHLNSTVLPTGDVLISTGTSGNGHNEAPYALAVELYNAKTKSFKTLNNLAVGRGYHSVALLLPDGRIMIGGGGNCGGCHLPQGDQNNVEYFKPPYLFKPDGSGGQTEVTSRPSITNVTTMTGTPLTIEDAIEYGQEFKLETTGTIARVTMIKLGAVTHARNFDQNFNELAFTANGSSLTATTPSEAAWATPGHYMVFAIDSAGVPSVAKIIKLQ